MIVRSLLVLPALLLLAQSAYSESAIFWTSSPVRPGETVLVTGFFPKPTALSVKVLNLTGPERDWQKSVSNTGTAVRTTRATESVISFVLPAGPVGVYAFQIEQAGEQALYGRINLPEIWWTLAESPTSTAVPGNHVETDSASPGDTLRVFGRCLSSDNKVPDAELVSDSGHIIALRATAESAYSLKATVPASTPEGKYTLRLRTVAGTPSSESSPQSLKIHAQKASSLKTINLKDFGAVGDGIADDSAAFKTALTKAAALGGAEIKIAAGAYLLKQPLEIPVRVYLAGESPDSTMLAFPQTDSPPDVWIKGTQYFGLRDLAIFTANHRVIVSSDMSGSSEVAGHVRIHNVRIVGNLFRKPVTPSEILNRSLALVHSSALGFETLRLSGPDNVVEDSYLLGSGRSLYLYRADGAIIRRNKLHNGIWGWYNIDCSENIDVEGNTIQGVDLLASGGGYSTYGDPKVSQNIYTADNSYSTFMGNDREALTTDGPGGAYSGPLLSIDGKRITLAGVPNWEKTDWHGAAVLIVAGHGLGQWRTVANWGDNGVELLEPFEIAPDRTSTLTITAAQRHYIIYRNHFEDAGISVQFFGTSIEHIAAENDSTRAGGFNATALNYHGDQPILNVQFLQNEIRPGLNYTPSIGNNPYAGPSALRAQARRGGHIIGLVFRNNVLADQAYIIVNQVPASQMTGILVEGNKVSKPSRDIRIDQATAPQVILH